MKLKTILENKSLRKFSVGDVAMFQAKDSSIYDFGVRPLTHAKLPPRRVTVTRISGKYADVRFDDGNGLAVLLSDLAPC